MDTSWICSIWHLHQPPTLNLTTACLRSLLTNAGLTSARLACGPNMPQIFSFLEFCILSLLLVKMASAWEDTEIMTSPWSSSACNGLRLKNRGRGILFQDKEKIYVLWRNYVILETDLFIGFFHEHSGIVSNMMKLVCVRLHVHTMWVFSATHFVPSSQSV